MSTVTHRAFAEEVINFAETCREHVQNVQVEMHCGDACEQTATITMLRGNMQWTIPIGVSGDDQIGIAVNPETEGYLTIDEGGLYTYLWEQSCQQIEKMERQQQDWLERRDSENRREYEKKEMLRTFNENGYPKYPVSDWQQSVSDGKTKSGYAEWVLERINREALPKDDTTS
jgi:hypothetical protein